VVIVLTSFALVSMMFLIMVRVTDPLMPRAIFGVLNTLLFFPSGAVYPPQAFPNWMRAIAAVAPVTYFVHAFKSLLLKNTGFTAISGDLLYLGFSGVHCRGLGEGLAGFAATQTLTRRASRAFPLPGGEGLIDFLLPTRCGKRRHVKLNFGFKECEGLSDQRSEANTKHRNQRAHRFR